MRTLIVFFMLAIAVGMCNAQWYQQNTGTARNLNAVTFIDANTGFVVGDSGIILHTNTGGATWLQQTSGTANHLYELCFIDLNTGFAVGDSGTILKTANGGTIWSQLSTGTDYSLNGVCFVDAATGWVVGGYRYWPDDVSILLHTTNGGIDWTQQTFEDTTGLNDVYFTDINNGWAVGWKNYPNYEGIILRTTNGGNDWLRQTSGTDRVLYDVEFIDANIGWAVGGAIGPLPLAGSGWPADDGPGIVLKTVDGGITWITQMDTVREALFGVSFLDSSFGFATGYYYSRGGSGLQGGTIIHTADGGVNWTSQMSEHLSRFCDVDFIDANAGWVVGEDVEWDSVSGYTHNGMILHTTNGGLTFVEGEGRDEVPSEFLLSQNYPNPFNPSTTIRYALPHTSFVTLTVYNTLGQQVAQLVNEHQQAGHHDVVFRGDGLASGVYFYRLAAGGFVEVKKLALLK